jgi:hypothetical protein
MFSTELFTLCCSRFRSLAPARFVQGLRFGCGSLRFAALRGAIGDFLHIYSDHRCSEPVEFRREIIAVTAIANAVGVAIYVAGKKRQRG